MYNPLISAPRMNHSFPIPQELTERLANFDTDQPIVNITSRVTYCGTNQACQCSLSGSTVQVHLFPFSGLTDELREDAVSNSYPATDYQVGKLFGEHAAISLTRKPRKMVLLDAEVTAADYVNREGVGQPVNRLTYVL